MGVRWVLGALALLISCDTGSGKPAGNGSRSSGNYTVDWSEVTVDESGLTIPWQSIFYTVYIDNTPYETTNLFHEGRVKKGCVMIYVTATRTDLDEWLESKPSEVVGVCRE